MLVLSAVVVAAYLALTGLVVWSGLAYVAAHPQLWQDWVERVIERPSAVSAATGALAARDWLSIGGRWLGIAVWCFPQIALGLSGFELIMTVAPRVRGRAADGTRSTAARVRNTRKLMAVAATVMAVYMLSAVLAGPPGWCRRRRSCPAATPSIGPWPTWPTAARSRPANRPAPLNPWFGERFGDLYDLSTVAILCLAGASVMMGLRGLVAALSASAGNGIELGRPGERDPARAQRHHPGRDGRVSRQPLGQQWAYATSVLVLMGGRGAGRQFGTSTSGWQNRAGGCWPWRRWVWLVVSSWR